MSHAGPGQRVSTDASDWQGISISITKGQVCTKQPRRLRPQCGPISHPAKSPELVRFFNENLWDFLKTSQYSLLSLNLYLSGINRVFPILVLFMTSIILLINSVEPRTGLLSRVSSMRSSLEEPAWLLISSGWALKPPLPLALCECTSLLFLSRGSPGQSVMLLSSHRSRDSSSATRFPSTPDTGTMHG